VLEFEQSDSLDLEEIELNLIDYGLEEMDVQNDRVVVYGEFTSFGDLTKACEDMGIVGVKATLQRIANSPAELTEAQIEEVEVLIDKLEEDDDVQSVFTNLA
jgi:transcriptional/translational regulatory protein YebC/TACO1